MVWDQKSGCAFFAGFLSQRKGENKIDIRTGADGVSISRIDAWQGINTEAAPGRTFVLDPLLTAEGKDPYIMLEKYGDEVSRHIRRRFDEPPVVGMMTWYGYRASITEEIVLKNAEIIRDVFGGYPQKMQIYMLLDHGWQYETEWGSMNHNTEQFTHGIPWLASKIKSLGLKFGLWHTPFCITQYAGNRKELEPLTVTATVIPPLRRYGSRTGNSGSMIPIRFRWETAVPLGKPGYGPPLLH